VPENILTSIFGNAIASGSELEDVSAVPITPPSIVRSHIGEGGAVKSDNTKDQIWLQIGDKHRIPYNCTITGIRIQTPQNLSSETLAEMEFLVFDGSTSISSKTVRGRSESIVASRWVPEDGYIDILFSNPVEALRNDQWGFFAGANGASDETIMPLFFAMNGERSSGTNGETSGTTFTSLNSTFISDGLSDGDKLLIYNLGTSTNHGYYTIDSVDSETQMTVSSSFSANSTGHYYSAGYTMPDHGVRRIRESLYLSGDGPFDLSNVTNAQHEIAILPITLLVQRAPIIALVGDSIMAGSDSTSVYGSLSSWSNESDTYSYDEDHDLGKLYQDLTGQIAVSLGVSGKDIEDWVGETVWRRSTGGDSEETEVFQTMRPTTIIYSTIANDCKKSWNQTVYTGYLDNLKSATDTIGATLILTTGTPLSLPGRSVEEQAKATDMREWIVTWASSNGVQVIDTHSQMSTSDVLSDGVHLKDEGNTKLIGLIVDGIRNLINIQYINFINGNRNNTASITVSRPFKYLYKDDVLGTDIPVHSGVRISDDIDVNLL